MCIHTSRRPLPTQSRARCFCSGSYLTFSVAPLKSGGGARAEAARAFRGGTSALKPCWSSRLSQETGQSQSEAIWHLRGCRDPPQQVLLFKTDKKSKPPPAPTPTDTGREGKAHAGTRTTGTTKRPPCRRVGAAERSRAPARRWAM